MRGYPLIYLVGLYEDLNNIELLMIIIDDIHSFILSLILSFKDKVERFNLTARFFLQYESNF